MDPVSIILPLAEIAFTTGTIGKAYWEAHGNEFLYNVTTYGFPSALLLEFIPGAGRTIYRVKHHLLGHEEEHIALFKNSFTESFAMIGVAGAIIAQIAITGLSLDKLDQTHWTAYASFVVSVIAGCLSVYYSCTMQLLLSGLHGPQEILEWLTAPKRIYQPATFGLFPMIPNLVGLLSVFRQRLDAVEPSGSYSVSSILRSLRSALTLVSEPEAFEDVTGIPFNSPEWLERRKPSVNAALLLVAPSQFLTLSLGAFLTGQGIYLGMLYGSQIVVVQGDGSALRIMITYIVVTAISLIIYGGVLAMKTREDWLLKRKPIEARTIELQQQPEATEGTLEAATSDRGDHTNRQRPVRANVGADDTSGPAADVVSRPIERLIVALEAAIRTQVAQMEAQRALLRSLRCGELQHNS